MRDRGLSEVGCDLAGSISGAHQVGGDRVLEA